MLTGRLIALEGIDGAGKTTLAKRLHEALIERSIGAALTGEKRSPLADGLRNGALARLSPLEKVYAFAYDRAWAYEHEAKQVLETGGVVLWDRYVMSALAYRQAEFALGLHNVGREIVSSVNAAFPPATLTLYLDIPIKEAAKRGKAPEGRQELLRRVRKEYEALLSEARHIRIDAGADPDIVCQQAVEAVLKLTANET